MMDFFIKSPIVGSYQFSLVESIGRAVFFVFNNTVLFSLIGTYNYTITNSGKLSYKLLFTCFMVPIAGTILSYYQLTFVNEKIHLEDCVNYTLAIIIVILVSRWIVSLLYSRMKVENIAIIGYSSIGEKYIEEMAKKKHLSVKIIGFITCGEANEGTYDGLPCLGDLKDWEKIVQEQVVDQVTMVPHLFLSGQLSEYVVKFENRGIVFNILLDIIDSPMYHVSEEMIGSLTCVKIHTVSLDEMQLFLKRAMDIVVSMIGIIFFLVFFIVFGPLIKLDSKGPILFKQDRVGLNGRIFKIWKFRTMVLDAEEQKKNYAADNEMGRNMFKIKNDPRVTRLGKFLRKTSIDEFPQFINVLKGDMSVVGTRPPTLDEVANYTNEEHRRISVFPGITGIWQISGRSEIVEFDEILRIEEEYISNWSILLDIKILIKTIKVVILCEGAE